MSGEGRIEPAAPSRTAAFFDVDNTIIRGASAAHLGRRLYQLGFFTTSDLIRFSIHLWRYLIMGENLRQISQIRDRVLSMFAGKSVAQITAVGEEVYDEVLSHRIFPGTKSILQRHLDDGDEVWLVSATPTEVGDLIASRLGVTGALGTIAERRDGFYTGKLIGDLMHGSAKADAIRDLAIREGIDLQASYAYGDSINDLPMLQAVGHPVGINPERRLRKYCAQHGWPVHDFRRSRRNARRGINVSAIAGGVWFSVMAIRSLYRRLMNR